MATTKLLYALRMPSDLKRHLDSEAEKRGVTTSQLVIEACWSYLEEPRGSSVVRAPDDGGESFRSSLEAAGSIPAPSSKLSAALAIPGVSLGMSKPTTPLPDAQLAAVEVAICGFAWWEDGAEYQCLMDRGHKAAKHGQHGMVVKLGE